MLYCGYLSVCGIVSDSVFVLCVCICVHLVGGTNGRVDVRCTVGLYPYFPNT